MSFSVKNEILSVVWHLLNFSLTFLHFRAVSRAPLQDANASFTDTDRVGRIFTRESLDTAAVRIWESESSLNARVPPTDGLCTFFTFLQRDLYVAADSSHIQHMSLSDHMPSKEDFKVGLSARLNVFESQPLFTNSSSIL